MSRTTGERCAGARPRVDMLPLTVATIPIRRSRRSTARCARGSPQLKCVGSRARCWLNVVAATSGGAGMAAPSRRISTHAGAAARSCTSITLRRAADDYRHRGATIQPSPPRATSSASTITRADHGARRAARPKPRHHPTSATCTTLSAATARHDMTARSAIRCDCVEKPRGCDTAVLPAARLSCAAMRALPATPSATQHRISA